MNHPIILENCLRGRKYCPYFTSEKLINTEAKWLVQGHKARNCTGGQWVGLHILLSSQVIICWLQQEINIKVAGVHRRNREINYVNFLQCARNHTKHFMPVFCQNSQLSYASTNKFHISTNPICRGANKDSYLYLKYSSWMPEFVLFSLCQKLIE